MKANKAKTLRALLPAARSSKSAGKASDKAIDSSFKTSIVSYLLTENAAANLEAQLSGDVASSVDTKESKGSSNVPAVALYDSDEAYNLSSENDICGVKLMFTPMDAHNRSISREQKKAYHERKQRWIFKNSQGVKFRKLIEYCGTTLGVNHAVDIFGRFGRDSGLKEYNSLIQICVNEALNSEDEKDFLEQFYRACELFMSMKEHALQLDEETYGPALMVLINMHRVDEFSFLIDIIKDVNPSMNSRLGYYEMLLAIEVNDDNKIQELSGQIASDDSDCLSILQEQYLVALCERDRKEMLEVLERIDITQVSSVENLSHIFSSLGRQSLESFALQFTAKLKDYDQMSDNISMLLACYATSMTNLTVEEAVSKFRSMHTQLELEPSSLSCQKVIKFCCYSLEVHEALNIANGMLEAGFSLSVETLHCVLRAIEESCDFHLVHQLYSMLRRFDVNSDSETYRSMISLYVRSKDFGGAYSVLEDLQKLNVSPTAGMYNAIMGGYFREKNVGSALKVLDEMRAANVEPDSHTFGYLIGSCDREEDIIKYYEELKSSGIQVTKHVYMALINAYANSGQFEKAKQVVFDKRIEEKDLNDVRSALISSLASHGRLSDALALYEDVKLTGSVPAPKAIVALIEHLQSSEELSTMLQLVDELDDPNFWVDGCRRVISYCVRHKSLRDTIDLLDELINRFSDDIFEIEAVITEIFSNVAEMEPPDVKFGLELLQAIKDELMLQPSRRCLDFLLSAAVTANDPQSAGLIWDEYRAAGLPHNILGFLRMYRVFLASGNKKSANKILKNIPLDDDHVCSVIRECQVLYSTPRKKGKNKKKVKVKSVEEL